MLEDKGKYAELFGPIIVDLRSRRKPYDETWLAIHSAYKGKPTRAFFKSELFHHYLPQLRRSVEKFVIRCAQMLVPTPEFFEVFPGNESVPDEAAEKVHAFFYYLFTRRIKVYNLARILARCYGLYGRCIVKSSVITQEAVLKDPETRADIPIVMIWPHARAVDPFSFYVFPETVTDLDQSQVIVEDVMMPYNQYKTMADDPKFEITSIPQAELRAPAWPETWQRRLQQVPLPTPETLAVGKSPDSQDRPKQLVDFVNLSEVWAKKGNAWCRYWIVWNVSGGPVCVRYTETDITRSPYRMAAARDIPGEHYGTGMGEDLEPLQVLLNDQVNMALEGQVTQFAPPAVIDPDMVSRANSIVFRPRAKWLMKPEGVKWLEVKGDNVARAGLMGMQFTMGLMDQFAGSSPMSDGQPQRNMPRAGFALQSMMNLSLTDVKDAAMMMETEIFTPLMADLYYLAMKFIPKNQRMRIPGGNGLPPSSFTKADIMGDFDFNWVGSLQSQDTQVRAQRLVQLLGIFAKLAPAISQDLIVQGKKMDWEYMFRRVWRDGLGERGAGSFIRQMTQQEMQMVQQMMQQQQAAGQAAQAKTQTEVQNKQADTRAKVAKAGKDEADTALKVRDLTSTDVESKMNDQINRTTGGSS